MRRLLWKLVASNLLVIGVVIFIVWMAVDYLAADYFAVLMEKYHVSPTDAHRMFLVAVHRYIIWASCFAMLCAAIISLVLTRRLLRPLSQMTAISKQIATGDYSAKVKLTSQDEVGQLAQSFNQMAESLQRIEHLRRTMVSDVAHELRTPLTNTRGYLEALRDGVVAPNTETFELLHEEILRLVHLVEDLLQLTKADVARMTLRRREVVFQELIEQALDLFQPQFIAKEITVKTLLARRDVIAADPDKLAQAMRNVLQNAWQYTPRGGEITLTVSHEGGCLTLSVVNSGEGIPQADLPFIFERFYRGEKSRSRERGGAGIGLAIVKELIEAHGGRVGAESTPGTTHIWLTLPV
jgi:two-component system sensor histidine kinase BaeS